MTDMTPKGQFTEALGKAQSEIEAVKKDKTAKVRMKTGGEYSYSYADLASVIEVVKVVLHKHGMGFTQTPCYRDGAFVLETEVSHSGGHSIIGHWPLASGGGPQEMGAILTYAKRYSLTSMLGIASEEDTDGNPQGKLKDPDKGAVKKEMDRAQKAAVYTLIDDLGAMTDHVGADAFLDAFGKLLKASDDAGAAFERNSKPVQAIQAKAIAAKDQKTVARCSAAYDFATAKIQGAGMP